MKSITESKSILSEVMLPSQANPAGKVHGGEIMKIMDTCGGVAAMRHAKTNVVTVRVDELVFYQSIQVGQLVICEAEVSFVGKTSMEIHITVKVEDMTSNTPTKIALTAFFTYVALDSDGKPCVVPELLLETKEEKMIFEQRKQKYLENKRK
ncbi:MAG: acyl-CoA thioesterase [Clostridiales bacterium GWF2_36_10]|nr:MAG: acyl-CoA thioesterase [Clostridiales bacterium GWF2_36_10]HAN20086.1 acyl-CoA thioesterase [Clostridiales bacterium]